jgi:hypothetical protein
MERGPLGLQKQDLLPKGIVKALPESQLLPTGKVIIDQAPPRKVVLVTYMIALKTSLRS